ncbi:hypothetical protein [Abyssibacter profundi]|uniref:Uncharacterized protein n=1 Tax=Abyssibacter profundi TaxID=2182787 RepID=A0A363UPW5_9GAMM|nr:hypothetical protein [Abyssibacter profundi]MBV62579.1 hypothetical protein [Nevskiales bacterium]PWN57482.1 hypothetical protein DEH80_03060 [Abyssibacter profundi]
MDSKNDLSDLEARMDRARRTLEELRAEHDEVSQQSQHEEIDRLEAHLASTEHKLADLRTAGAEAWHEIRAAIETLWEDITHWKDRRPPSR